MARTAIILLAWNKLEYTKKCLGALYHNTPIGSFDLILIDNGSSDGTLTYFTDLQKTHPEITVLRNPKNLGFGNAMNQGIRLALETDHDRVCLLNNDTEVRDGWLKSLEQCADSDQKIGMVQSNLVSFEDGRSISCGVDLDLSSENFLRPIDIGKTVPDLRGVTSDRFYLNGACVLIKKEFVESVGLFSSEFFPVYHEETDLCIRGYKAGWRMVFCGDSVVQHHEAVTGHSLPGRGEPIFWNNWNKLLNKHAAYIHDLAHERFGLDAGIEELRRFNPSMSIEGSSKLLAETWKSKDPKSKEAVDRFYKESSGYIGDLLAWNAGSYKKELVDHVIYASRHFSVRSILDIGAGILSDTIKLRNSGISMTTVDFDSEHYRFGIDRLGYRRIKDVNVKYVGDELPKCDAIMLFDVIEHVHEPDKFLDAYVEKSDGFIFMTVPENLPPDESEKHPMHLVQYADFWKQIPQYLEQKHGFKRVDLITFKKD
jgi:GT2 family glycosyltransferase